MIKALTGTVDFYKCMHIKLSNLPENFQQVLEVSLVDWTQQHLKAVWLFVPNFIINVIFPTTF